MNKERKYFYIFDIEEAERVRDLTDERYYKFTNTKGQEYYSFNNTKEVVVAYKMIKSWKSKLNRKELI